MNPKDDGPTHPHQTNKTVAELQARIEALEAELKSAQQNSIKSHGYKVVATHTSNSVLIVDPEGVAQWVNPSFEKLSGRLAQEIIGKPTEKFLVGAETNLETIKDIFEQMRAKQSFTYEVVHYNSQNEPYQIITNGEPILCEDGSLLGYAMIETDITLLKVMEEALTNAYKSAEEKEAAKRNLLANLSHEFRTPLNGILGLGQLLLSTTLDEEQADYTQTILESADVLSGLIEKLLSMTPSSQPEPTTLERIDLRKMLSAKVCQHEQESQNKDIQFALEIAENVPAEIELPWMQTYKILNFICENAVKFTDAGQILLNVELKEENSLSFTISDSGIGIHPDALPLIFDEYYQVDESHTRAHGGIGLGLSLAKKIASNIGATISVESTFGHGCTFTLCVPISSEPVGG